MTIIKIDQNLCAPSLEEYEVAVQAVIDGTAREQQFRDGVTLASYVTDEDEPFWAAQARAFIKWRTAVWKFAYRQLADVQSGQRAQPTIEEFLKEIPPIAWPE